jgi:hypothetical protein
VLQTGAGPVGGAGWAVGHERGVRSMPRKGAVMRTRNRIATGAAGWTLSRASDARLEGGQPAVADSTAMD